MNWEHFQLIDLSNCTVIRATDGAVLNGWCEIGSILTGKQRVWQGYKAQLEVDDHTLSARDPHNLIDSLQKLGAQCEALGYQLRVVGLLPGFSESGMSANSGSGYYDGKRVDMLDRVESDA